MVNLGEITILSADPAAARQELSDMVDNLAKVILVMVADEPESHLFVERCQSILSQMSLVAHGAWARHPGQIPDYLQTLGNPNNVRLDEPFWAVSVTRITNDVAGSIPRTDDTVPSLLDIFGVINAALAVPGN